MQVRGSGRVVAGVAAVGLLAGFIALGVALDANAGRASSAAASAAESRSPAPTAPPAAMPPNEGNIGDLVQAALQRAATADPPEGDDAEVRAPCVSTVSACVQVSTQHVWLMRGGRVVRDGFISSGATDMETPTGMFEVQYKSLNHVSGISGTPMPYSVFFDTNGDALHEGSLARQSAGCVHLTRDDARAFYDALRPGDGVQILP